VSRGDLDQWRARAQVIRNAGGGMILVPVEVLESLLDQAVLVEGLVTQCRDVITRTAQLSEAQETETIAMVRAETVVRMLDT
jgi:hypothetical protein